MMNVLNYLMVRFASKKGQGMVEYGLILGGIAVAVVAAVALFGDSFSAFIQQLIDYITDNGPV